MKVYSLTPLTREASLQRRVVFAGFDVAARSLIVALIGLGPALVVTAVAWLAFGEYALALIPIVEAGVFWLIESRTRDGMRLRQYRAIYDRRRAAVGKFFMCGVEIHPARSKALNVISSSVPVAPRSAGLERPAARASKRRPPKAQAGADDWAGLVAS